VTETENNAFLETHTRQCSEEITRNSVEMEFHPFQSKEHPSRSSITRYDSRKQTLLNRNDRGERQREMVYISSLNVKAVINNSLSIDIFITEETFLHLLKNLSPKKSARFHTFRYIQRTCPRYLFTVYSKVSMYSKPTPMTRDATAVTR
ncbi:hypothetical protein ALC62_01181, partial [Cyphomyrmex costatus]